MASPVEDAGEILLHADAPTANLATPSALKIPFDRSNVTVITNASGTILQVKTPQGLVNVAVIDPYEYALQCFYATNVTALVGGLYGTNAAAFDTYDVKNPDGATSNNRLWITETPANGGASRQFQYSYNANNSKWDLLQPDGQSVLSTWKVPDASNMAITNFYRQISLGGQVASQSCKTYQYIPGWDMKLLLQEVNGTGASSTTNFYTYYTNGTAANLLQRVDYADGNWVYYTYDDYGRKLKEYAAYNNSAPPETGEPDPLVDHCKLTIFTYDTDPSQGGVGYVPNSRLPYSTEVDVPVLGASGWELQMVAYKTESEYVGSGYSIDDVMRYINPSMDSSSLETYTEASNAGITAGRPTLVLASGGTQTTYSYPDPYTTVTTYFDDSQTTNVVDDLGHPLSLTKIDVATGVVLARQSYTYTNSSGGYYDQLRRSHDVTDLAGRVTQYRYSDCCGEYTVTDPDGNVTQYKDDLLKRSVVSTVYYDSTNGITITNNLDAAGQILQTRRVGTDGSTQLLSQAQYDLLGRVIRQTNSLGGVTTTAYGVINHQRCVTNTYPDGGTRIEVYYRDGRLQSLSGTAVHPVQYLYGVEQDTDGNWREYTQEINLTAMGGTNEWTKTYVDGVGREYKTIYSAANTPYPYSQSYYNQYGEIWKQVNPDGVTTLSVYNNNQGDVNQGQLEYRITALSADALTITYYDDLVYTWLQTLMANGIDRIQKVSRSVVPASNGLPDLVQQDTYAWTNAQTDTYGTLVSSRKISTDGLQSWNITYADEAASVTNQTITSPGSSRTEMVVAPDGSYSINTYSYGRLVANTRYDSGNNPIGSTGYTYDAHGRQYQVTDARNGTTTYGYNNADQVTSVTTPNPGNGGSPETTTTLYDNMMRPYEVIQPDNTTVYSDYLLTGELGLQYGSRTYPVAYSYDYAGRMKMMTNWSGFSGLTGARVTTWNYDSYRGFLTSKVYDDNHGPSYTYTAGGRLATRTWERGITTSYNYDNAGSLTNVSYSDLTPAVTNYYDRLGRLSSVVCNGLTDTMAYNLASGLLTESFSGGILNGLRVTNSYDGFLRRTNLSVLNGSTLLASAAYGYDNASRLQTVNDGSGNSATYGYLANSPLMSQITFKQSGTTRMTTSKQYDYLNRLTQISSTPSGSGAVPATFNYDYNAANQRTKDTLVDGSYWVYQYDSLGQVTSGKKYWSDGTPVAGQQFGYAFDDIGNRTQIQRGGDAAGGNLRTAIYQANSLNQITNRVYPGTNDIVGVALATNSVAVNGQTAYRHGEYFWAAVQTNNTASPKWQGVTVASGGSTNTGGLFVPQTPEQLKYDADGNLTNDGHWSYTWDAENRLTQMTVNTNVGPQYRLTFVYDSKGRRIEKIVATNGVAISTNEFLYDGWDLIAILNPQSSILQSFVWGTDLSGTMQGAGGVGGLLEVSYYGASSTNCFPAFDGNGNLMALVNAADGTTAANYEYGPFGETIRMTGTMAKNNPFRFSTKYQDDESDLLYYGYRYYNPSTGTWPNHDPLGDEAFLKFFSQGKTRFQQQQLRFESLGPAYLFIGNTPLNAIDGFGLKKVKTGVKWCGEPGMDGHEWLEYPGGSAGFYPAGNIFWGPGQIENPDPHDTDKDKDCADIELDDCAYDIQKFVNCVKQKSAPGKNGQIYSFCLHNCGSWVGGSIRACKEAAKK